MTGSQGNRKKQLSQKTATAMHHTCNGIVCLCRHFFATSHKHVLLGQFSTDPLEKEFTKFRQGSPILFIVYNWNHFEMRLLNLRINFYLLRTFCPHLGSFFVCVCCFFFHYVSAKFHLWPSSGDFPRPRIGMLSLVTVSPVITAFHSCCLSHHVFLPSGPVALRIEALSLYGPRWAWSEDSGFKSYPSRPEVYLVKNVVR